MEEASLMDTAIGPAERAKMRRQHKAQSVEVQAKVEQQRAANRRASSELILPDSDASESEEEIVAEGEPPESTRLTIDTTDDKRIWRDAGGLRLNGPDLAEAWSKASRRLVVAPHNQLTIIQQIFPRPPRAGERFDSPTALQFVCNFPFFHLSDTALVTFRPTLLPQQAITLCCRTFHCPYSLVARFDPRYRKRAPWTVDKEGCFSHNHPPPGVPVPINSAEDVEMVDDTTSVPETAESEAAEVLAQLASSRSEGTVSSGGAERDTEEQGTPTLKRDRPVGGVLAGPHAMDLDQAPREARRALENRPAAPAQFGPHSPPRFSRDAEPPSQKPPPSSYPPSAIATAEPAAPPPAAATLTITPSLVFKTIPRILLAISPALLTLSAELERLGVRDERSFVDFALLSDQELDRLEKRASGVDQQMWKLMKEKLRELRLIWTSAARAEPGGS